MTDPLESLFVKHVLKYRPNSVTARLAREVLRLRESESAEAFVKWIGPQPISVRVRGVEGGNAFEREVSLTDALTDFRDRFAFLEKDHCEICGGHEGDGKIHDKDGVCYGEDRDRISTGIPELDAELKSVPLDRIAKFDCSTPPRGRCNHEKIFIRELGDLVGGWYCPYPGCNGYDGKYLYEPFSREDFQGVVPDGQDIPCRFCGECGTKEELEKGHLIVRCASCNRVVFETTAISTEREKEKTNDDS